MMYTSKSPLGANTFNRYTMTVTTNSHAWVKYVALALAVVAIRFLCCA